MTVLFADVLGTKVAVVAVGEPGKIISTIDAVFFILNGELHIILRFRILEIATHSSYYK